MVYYSVTIEGYRSYTKFYLKENILKFNIRLNNKTYYHNELYCFTYNYSEYFIQKMR